MLCMVKSVDTGPSFLKIPLCRNHKKLNRLNVRLEKR